VVRDGSKGLPGFRSPGPLTRPPPAGQGGRCAASPGGWPRSACNRTRTDRIAYREDGKRRCVDRVSASLTFLGCTRRAGRAPTRGGASLFAAFLPRQRGTPCASPGVRFPQSSLRDPSCMCSVRGLR
jgi:hypothetical protein